MSKCQEVSSWHCTPSWRSIMRKVTWRRFDQSAKQLVVGLTTIFSARIRNALVPVSCRHNCPACNDSWLLRDGVHYPQHRSRCAVLGVSTVKMAIALQRHLLCSFTALQLISGMSPNIFVLCVGFRAHVKLASRIVSYQLYFTGFKIIDTDRIVCDGSMQRYGVRQSVRLSVPSIDRCSSARRVAAVGHVGRKYRSTTAPPQQRPSATNASSVISSADWGRWTQICIWERT